jgi:hypothetical protein
VHANGGAGGNVTDAASHGGGGGAGVGIILETHPTANSRVVMASVIGVNGKDCAGCTSATGAPAETPTSSKKSMSAIPGTIAALPIDLLYFSGNAVDDGVELTWATAMEENNDYFTIQRSTDGIVFDSILTVPGAGNSKTKSEYSIVDKTASGPVMYYQLKQTDYDKKSTTSKRVYVDTQTLVTEAIRVYPNPASSVLNIVNSSDGSMAIQLRNERGVVALSQTSNERETKLDVSNLKEGFYILEAVSGKNKQTVKIIIKH